ncbi:MAG: hypothetical protein IJE27_02370 [Anaerotignum sp.]|nr:hypothetical protein [Anaerotignum sp.]
MLKNCSNTGSGDGRKKQVFGHNVWKKEQYAEKNWGISDQMGKHRVLLFKICSFTVSFLVDFEIGHCENGLTLDIVCD